MIGSAVMAAKGKMQEANMSTPIRILIERFWLPFFAGALLLILGANPMAFNTGQRISAAMAAISVAAFLAFTFWAAKPPEVLEKDTKPDSQNKDQPLGKSSDESATTFGSNSPIIKTGDNSSVNVSLGVTTPIRRDVICGQENVAECPLKIETWAYSAPHVGGSTFADFKWNGWECDLRLAFVNTAHETIQDLALSVTVDTGIRHMRQLTSISGLSIESEMPFTGVVLGGVDENNRPITIPADYGGDANPDYPPNPSRKVLCPTLLSGARVELVAACTKMTFEHMKLRLQFQIPREILVTGSYRVTEGTTTTRYLINRRIPVESVGSKASQVAASQDWLSANTTTTDADGASSVNQQGGVTAGVVGSVGQTGGTTTVNIQNNEKPIPGTNATLSKLQDAFPFGYVIYSFAQGNWTYTPHPGERMQWQADWSKVKITPDFANNLVRLDIDNLSAEITKDGKPFQMMHNVSIGTNKFPMQVGTSYLIGGIRLPHEPAMLFTTLSDNQRAPVFVLGFRIVPQDPPAAPAPNVTK